MSMECKICGRNVEQFGSNHYLYDDKLEIREEYYCHHCKKTFDRFLIYVLKLIDEEWRFHGKFKAAICGTTHLPCSYCQPGPCNSRIN